LKNGAHIDQLDNFNLNPMLILQKTPNVGFSVQEHVTLKCITARAVCAFKVSYNDGDLPKELEKFVELHRPSLEDNRAPIPRNRSLRSHRL
jgi:hypothetical protein